MHKITSRWQHQSSIKIEWNLGKRCNYDCSYCPQEIHDNFSPHTSIEILKQAIDKLVKLQRPIRLSFTGGEPCVHPKFNEVINYAKNKQIDWVSVTTNGTRPYKFYAEMPSDHYVFSIHLEYDWHRAVETLIRLSNSTDKKLIGQIMAHHGHMTEVKKLRDLLSIEKIPYTIRRIRWVQGDHDQFNDSKYLPEDLEWIKEQNATVQENCLIDDLQLMHSNDIIKLHLNQFKGWTCNAGIESLMINWDGEVYRATCRVGGSLGNIYKDTFVVPVGPVICTRDWCTCAADIPITKLAL